MRVLILGSGGREHALAWKLAQSPECDTLLSAPGNPGMAALGECFPLNVLDNRAVVEAAKSRAIDLVVVGPEAPLCNGVVDALAEAGVLAFGPRAAAARIEGSKAFAKDIMRQAGAPTAEAETFRNPDAAWRYAQQLGAPLVVKADGLAAGKGVTVCADLAQARAAIDQALREKAFGAGGESILIEQFLDGEECSVFALCDGAHAITLVTSQDHKRIGEGDTGPNTGGMGAYSPAPVVDDAMLDRVARTVIEPVIATLARNNAPFVGVLYAGLMMCGGEPYVLEFNCRFGDPECQAVLPRMESDLLPLLVAAAEGTLQGHRIAWRPDYTACVVVAAAGYPDAYEKGVPIEGLDRANAVEDTVVFHAGTKAAGDRIVTSGGRVLGVTARGADLQMALDRAYRAIDAIHFDGMYYRRDIGHRALARRGA